ncbi:PIG-L family deacetylase, partial [Candidatus Woesearchaeota archaeon]|nr:PIG-L family deacetylase [Candidatus Woesearchaeota archaeon]
MPSPVARLINLRKRTRETSTIENLKIKKTDRVLILAPHPDDEALTCAGIIQNAVSLSIPIKVVFLTMGDGNELSFLLYKKRPMIRSRSVQSMGMLRCSEAKNSTKLLGLHKDQVDFLGYPDIGTLRIWTRRWQHEPA